MKLNILFLNNRKTLFKYFLIGKYILYFLILLLKNIFFHQDNMTSNWFLFIIKFFELIIN